MKKARIFMAAGAILLAIVGVASSKASSKFATYYYQAGSSCVTIGATDPCRNVSGTTTCTYSPDGGITFYPVFTASNVAQTVCSSPLLYAPN